MRSKGVFRGGKGGYEDMRDISPKGRGRGKRGYWDMSHRGRGRRGYEDICPRERGRGGYEDIYPRRRGRGRGGYGDLSPEEEEI